MDRRTLLAGAAASPALLRAQGANNRIRTAHIGLGTMGSANLKFAMQQPSVEVAALCDVKTDALERAMTTAHAAGQHPRQVRDFREILTDKSIDAVVIAAPDHWHAYMTVEGCKAGKDVWVEKPVCTVVDEGLKMVAAARKYDRVVQVGTMQRSGEHFQKAVDFVRSGRLGKITLVRTFNYMKLSRSGNGAIQDREPPAGIDWDLWLGPAPYHRYNPVRSSHEFRRYWDYAGGMLTDWGAHWIDIVQMAMDEEMPVRITANGGKFWVTDDRETPDTLQALYMYRSGMLASYETRPNNLRPADGMTQGIIYYASEGTMVLNRAGYHIYPEKGSALEEIEVKSSNNSNLAHWTNFVECVRTRRRPNSDIERSFRSSAACLLGNVAWRSNLQLTWDGPNKTVLEAGARHYLTREYRPPWKLEV